MNCGTLFLFNLDRRNCINKSPHDIDFTLDLSLLSEVTVKGTFFGFVIILVKCTYRKQTE